LQEFHLFGEKENGPESFAFHRITGHWLYVRE